MRRAQCRATLSHLLTVAALTGLPALVSAQDVSTRFSHVTSATQWNLVNEHQVNFDTHHPQGLARVGEDFYLSSVEVIDRAQSLGKAHLFRLRRDGTLAARVDLTDGPRYHPGGIDYDGTRLWISVAEYRPNSSSVVIVLDPETLNAQTLFSFGDHLGAIAHDPASNNLVGMSWGSRTLYRWRTRIDQQGAIVVENPDAPAAVRNPAHYIDYQDVQWIPGTTHIVCGGVKSYPAPGGRGRIALGGFELLDSETLTLVHMTPVALWDPSGRSMLQNPFHVDSTENGLRVWFMPADNTSTLFEYEVTTEQ